MNTAENPNNNKKDIMLPLGPLDLFPPTYEIINHNILNERSQAWGKIRQKTFIETGTFHGHGVTSALSLGFKDIHSIEINPLFFNTARFRIISLILVNKENIPLETYSTPNFFSVVFDDEVRISLYLGDTVEVLPQVLKRVEDSAFFWLDAHWSGDKTNLDNILNESTPLDQKVPILKELEIIKAHTIKNNTICIDDYDQVCSAVGSFKKLKNKILEINNQFRVKVKGSENKIVIADLGEQGA